MPCGYAHTTIAGDALKSLRLAVPVAGDTWIFASRLYRHYDELVAAGMLAGNPKLIALSARQMAVSLGQREP